jgi:hypothetical protein
MLIADHSNHEPNNVAQSREKEAASPDLVGVPGALATATVAGAGDVIGVTSAWAPATVTVAGAGDVLPVPVPPAQDASAPHTSATVLPILPGWAQLNASATKLWATLAYLGACGKATQKELARVAGMSERTVLTALANLQTHGLLVYTGNRGEGTCWQLLKIPETLPDAAKQHYAARLTKKAVAIERRRLELDEERQALDDAASGVAQDRFRTLAAEIAARATEKPSADEAD